MINCKTLNPSKKPKGHDFVIVSLHHTLLCYVVSRLPVSSLTGKRNPVTRSFANEYGRCPKAEVSEMRMGYKGTNPNMNFLYNDWSAEENSSNSKHQCQIRQKVDRLALCRRMCMTRRVVIERRKGVRVSNRSPMKVVSMIKRSSRDVITQEEYYKRPFTCFSQDAFHVYSLIWGEVTDFFR